MSTVYEVSFLLKSQGDFCKI